MDESRGTPHFQVGPAAESLLVRRAPSQSMQDLSRSNVREWNRAVELYRVSLETYSRVMELKARRVAARGRKGASRPAEAAEAVRPPSQPKQVAVAPEQAPAPVSAAPTAEQAGRKCPLTARQLEIAGLVAAGMTNRQIADQLVLVHGTVANHIEHILGRIAVRNRAQIATWFTEWRHNRGEGG